MLINKRINSDPAAAGGNNADLKYHSTQTAEKTATELVHLLLYGGFSWDLLVFSRSMGYGDLRAVFRGEWYYKKRTQLWRSLLTDFFFEVNLSVHFMGYRLQHIFPAFLPRTWYVDFLCRWLRGRVYKTSQKRRRAASSCHSTNSVRKSSSTAGSD